MAWGAAGNVDGDAGRFRPQVTPTCSNPKLSYYDGPLIQTPRIVTVFWSGNVNAALTAPTTGLAQFFTDVEQSGTYLPWLQEYDTVGITGGSEQAILAGSMIGTVTLVPSRCASTTKCTVTDAEIQTELNAQIVSGVLPAPVADCTGNTETLYMISFPPNVTVSGPDGAGTSCANNGFCAYHNTGTYAPTNIPLIYGVLPDEFTSACNTGCGNGTAMQNTTSTASHELVEAITDPDIGLIPATSPNVEAPAAWYDQSNNCGEIADICDTGAADTITVSGRVWSVQELWSNKQGKCTSTGPDPAVCSGTTLTSCRKCSCGDTGNACTGGTGVCETTSTNVLFGACEQCTSTDSTACGTSACTQSTTASQDDVCAACTPITSCPAGDNCGTISNGCGGMVVCGTPCTAPQTCGGGGTANQCGSPCTPLTACPAGDNCGTISNGCGGTLACGGACTAPETCGGGGAANQCGSPCTPLTACPAGDNCGTISNGCGGTLACGGACTAPETCGGGGAANQCGQMCVPLATCPAGLNCGTMSDGCGGTINCGACTTPQTCGGGGVANACGCAPLAACPAGQTCGSAPDGCGGTLSCGTCGAGQTCSGANQCVTVPVDAGTDSGSTDAGGADASTHPDANKLDAAIDAATGHDAAVDSSPSSDASPFADAGKDSATPPTDAEAKHDSGSSDSGALANHDGSTGPSAGDASVDGADAGDAVGQTGGCGCRTAQPTKTPSSFGILAFLPLALAARRRSRRRSQRA
jgi:hypothetical protein